jgi:hypothetical protein
VHQGRSLEIAPSALESIETGEIASLFNKSVSVHVELFATHTFARLQCNRSSFESMPNQPIAAKGTSYFIQS